VAEIHAGFSLGGKIGPPGAHRLGGLGRQAPLTPLLSAQRRPTDRGGDPCGSIGPRAQYQRAGARSSFSPLFYYQ